MVGLALAGKTTFHTQTQTSLNWKHRQNIQPKIQLCLLHRNHNPPMLQQSICNQLKTSGITCKHYRNHWIQTVSWADNLCQFILQNLCLVLLLK